MKGIVDLFPEIKKDKNMKNIIDSPHTIEEMVKAINDPNYLNTQLKNLDIAIARLETIPAGYNVLRSMLKSQKDIVINNDSTVFKEGSNEINESGSVPNPWNKNNFNPLVEYRKQVEYMKECGFTDTLSNIKLLVKHKGNVDEAINELLTIQSPLSPSTSVRR